MRNSLLVIICILSTMSMFGQENPAMTQRLKEKYDFVSYEDGYYRIDQNMLKKGDVGICDNRGVEIVLQLQCGLIVFKGAFLT